MNIREEIISDIKTTLNLLGKYSDKNKVDISPIISSVIDSTQSKNLIDLFVIRNFLKDETQTILAADLDNEAGEMEDATDDLDFNSGDLDQMQDEVPEIPEGDPEGGEGEEGSEDDKISPEQKAMADRKQELLDSAEGYIQAIDLGINNIQNGDVNLEMIGQLIDLKTLIQDAVDNVNEADNSENPDASTLNVLEAILNNLEPAKEEEEGEQDITHTDENGDEVEGDIDVDENGEVTEESSIDGIIKSISEGSVDASTKITDLIHRLNDIVDNPEEYLNPNPEAEETEGAAAEDEEAEAAAEGEEGSEEKSESDEGEEKKEKEEEGPSAADELVEDVKEKDKKAATSSKTSSKGNPLTSGKKAAVLAKNEEEAPEPAPSAFSPDDFVTSEEDSENSDEEFVPEEEGIEGSMFSLSSSERAALGGKKAAVLADGENADEFDDEFDDEFEDDEFDESDPGDDNFHSQEWFGDQADRADFERESRLDNDAVYGDDLGNLASVLSDIESAAGFEGDDEPVDYDEGTENIPPDAWPMDDDADFDDKDFEEVEDEEAEVSDVKTKAASGLVAEDENAEEAPVEEPVEEPAGDSPVDDFVSDDPAADPAEGDALDAPEDLPVEDATAEDAPIEDTEPVEDDTADPENLGGEGTADTEATTPYVDEIENIDFKSEELPDKYEDPDVTRAKEEKKENFDSEISDLKNSLNEKLDNLATEYSDTPAAAAETPAEETPANDTLEPEGSVISTDVAVGGTETPVEAGSIVPGTDFKRETPPYKKNREDTVLDKADKATKVPDNTKEPFTNFEIKSKKGSTPILAEEAVETGAVEACGDVAPQTPVNPVTGSAVDSEAVTAETVPLTSSNAIVEEAVVAKKNPMQMNLNASNISKGSKRKKKNLSFKKKR